MGDVTRKAPSQARPAMAKPDKTAVEARRTKNREAQHVFRMRRRAAETAQSRRVQQLEEAVEEMSQIFISLSDQVLQIEAIATQHPDLVSGLCRSVARILNLAKGLVNVDDTPMSGTPLEDAPKDTSESAGNSHPLCDPEPNLSESTGSGGSSSAPSVVESRSAGDSPPFSRGYSTGLIALPAVARPSVPRSIYPNSGSSLPYLPSHPEDLIRLPTVQEQSILGDLNAFPLRLLISTISRGYAFLRAAPRTDIHRMFAPTLRHRSVEQLTANFQWLLGPGRPFIHRACGMTWADGGGLRAIPASYPGSAVSNAPADYLTVIGVFEQLQNLNARMVDTDIMEVSIAAPPVDGGTIKPKPNALPPPVLQDSWSYFDFFPAQRPEINYLTLRLSVALLTSNLIDTAVCFTRGPGYPRDSLHNVIAASLVV